MTLHWSGQTEGQISIEDVEAADVGRAGMSF